MTPQKVQIALFTPQSYTKTTIVTPLSKPELYRIGVTVITRKLEGVEPTSATPSFSQSDSIVPFDLSNIEVSDRDSLMLWVAILNALERA